AGFGTVLCDIGIVTGQVFQHVGRHPPDPFRRRQHDPADVAHPQGDDVDKDLRSKLSAIARRSSALPKGGAAGLTSTVRGTLVGATSQIACGAWLLTSFKSGT